MPYPFYYYYYNNWLHILKRNSADVIEPMLYWRDYRYPEYKIKEITEYDIRLINEMKSKAKIMDVVGGNRDNTYELKGSKWASTLSYARQGGSKDVAVFAYECIRDKSVWLSIKRYLEQGTGAANKKITE